MEQLRRDEFRRKSQERADGEGPENPDAGDGSGGNFIDFDSNTPEVPTLGDELFEAADEGLPFDPDDFTDSFLPPMRDS